MSVIFVTKIKTCTRIISRRLQRTRTGIIVIQKTKKEIKNEILTQEKNENENYLVKYNGDYFYFHFINKQKFVIVAKICSH